jgi:hypothetical protein
LKGARGTFAHSDTTLIVSYLYNDAGWVETVTDPRGIAGKSFYDNLGQVTRTIEAYVDGTPSNSDDKNTEYSYDGSGNLLTLKALLAGGTYQKTEWVYGVTTGTGSDLNSNDLLSAVIDALTIGGSVAASIGSTSGAFNVSGAGSGSGNFVYNTVESYIDRRVLFTTTAVLLLRQLNEGLVSDDLRDAFAAEGFTLSTNLIVRARGSEDDRIYGQLGDDVIQGDGSIQIKFHGGIPAQAADSAASGRSGQRHTGQWQSRPDRFAEEHPGRRQQPGQRPRPARQHQRASPGCHPPGAAEPRSSSLDFSGACPHRRRGGCPLVGAGCARDDG